MKLKYVVQNKKIVLWSVGQYQVVAGHYRFDIDQPTMIVTMVQNQ